MQLHRTKWNLKIKQIRLPFFLEDLPTDIGEKPFSLLLDEINDISTTKLLGTAIIYYSYSKEKIVPTFLSLVDLEVCDALLTVDAVLKTLELIKLNLQKLQVLRQTMPV